jgi:hypothetical protein
VAIPKNISVSIPTENGFPGKECNGPNCNRYFKVLAYSVVDEMFCPYCGDKFSEDDLWSSEHIEYATKVAGEELVAAAHQDVSNMFSKAFSKSKSFTYKSGTPYRKKTIAPPKELQVDSEIACPECGSSFQVYGIFGFCPCCRSENILIYDTNWEIIKREIESSSNKRRALRHAYADLVSTFENFCRKKAKRLSIDGDRFQNIDHTRRLFKSKAGIDLLAGLTQSQIRNLKRVFEKRHIAEHNDSIIRQRYVEQIPEDKNLLGQQADLSVFELEASALVMKRVLENLL